jgi:hypothetical protein
MPGGREREKEIERKMSLERSSQTLAAKHTKLGGALQKDGETEKQSPNQAIIKTVT